MIIRKNSQAYQPVPLAKGICVGLGILHGDLNNLQSTISELKTITITNRLGFPDVIAPGIHRNDLYLTLEEGEFSQDKKNIEVSIQVGRYLGMG